MSGIDLRIGRGSVASFSVSVGLDRRRRCAASPALPCSPSTSGCLHEAPTSQIDSLSLANSSALLHRSHGRPTKEGPLLALDKPISVAPDLLLLFFSISSCLFFTLAYLLVFAVAPVVF